MSGHATDQETGDAVSRRRLLGWGMTAGLGLAATVAGCGTTERLFPDLPDTPRREQSTCVGRSSLPRYARLAELPLIYEVSRRRSEFAIETGFAGQLEAWLTDLVALTGWRAEQLWTYGTWTNGGSACSSWHNSGRAFDLARLRLADGSDVSCRYDLWRAASGGELARARRAYWAVAASAHKHFAYVLTHLYDAQHHNHIHLDNGRSGAELARFRGRSPAQVQAVQGILGQLWETPVEVTGRWDAGTAEAVRTVLAELDQGEDLSDQATWAGFLDASTRRGAQPA